ncbi:Hsp33 family molecular chaperone HslO, partial [Xanthomonas perforans]
MPPSASATSAARAAVAPPACHPMHPSPLFVTTFNPDACRIIRQPASLTPDVSMTDHDQLSRFLLPAAGVRGVHVRLTKAWHDIQGAAAYPPAARQLLGEAAVAAALFT